MILIYILRVSDLILFQSLILEEIADITITSLVFNIERLKNELL